MTLKNIDEVKKRGRPTKDAVSKFRTLFWYWAVRKKSGLNDGKLDIVFSVPDSNELNKKRSYVDRKRIFEDIRKTGATISEGKHKRRDFNLIELVDNHPDLVGSAEVYQSKLWEILKETKPTLKKTKIVLIHLIKVCELSKAKFKIFIPPSEDKVQALSELTDLTPSEISEIFELDINTTQRKQYDDILQSFSNVTHFNGLLEKVEFNHLSNYLNILAFYITFYRYALLTGNFHALVSSADSINEHLSLLLIEINWLEKEFSNALLNLIYDRVFLFGNTIGSNEFDASLFIDEVDPQKNESALYKLFELLNIKPS